MSTEDAARLAEIEERISIMDLIPAEDGAWLLAELAKARQEVDRLSEHIETVEREKVADLFRKIGVLRAKGKEQYDEIVRLSDLHDAMCIAAAAYRTDASNADAENERLRTALEGLPEQIAQAVRQEVEETPDRLKPLTPDERRHYLSVSETGRRIAARSFAAPRPTPAPEDKRPHSRACGIRKHDHGPECSRDCFTCSQGGAGE